nr:hypothetical protein Iba_chr02aCG15550 [Ipomoea batatas]
MVQPWVEDWKWHYVVISGFVGRLQFWACQKQDLPLYLEPVGHNGFLDWLEDQ